MMRKVAFLDYSHVFAGAERVLYNVISHIDRTKYEPVLIFPYPMDHQKRYDGLDCEKIYLADKLKWWMGSDRWKHPLRGTDFIKRAEFGRRIAKIINQKGIDILDVNLMRVDIKMWVLATRKTTNAKLIGHYRSQEQDWVAPGDAQRLFDLVACVSRFSKMRFQLKGKFVKSVVLYDSVDIDQMKSPLTKEEAKKELGYAADERLIISVGQLSRHKGHDTAIKAFAAVADRYPSLRLLIAGGGGHADIEYYRSLANEYGLSDRIQISGIQMSNIQTVYRAAELTLSLTKVGEGFGLVPYESALLDTPCIAPAFGASTEFIVDFENGLLVDTNDLEAVIGKLEYALLHSDEVYKMTDRLKKVIKERLSPMVLADNLDRLYSEL